MALKAFITLVYGLLIMGGGIAGYALKGSRPSLVTGGLFGLLAVIGAALMFAGNTYGAGLAMISAAMVAVFFGIQLMKARKDSSSLGRAVAILAISLVELAVLGLL